MLMRLADVAQNSFERKNVRRAAQFENINRIDRSAVAAIGLPARFRGVKIVSYWSYPRRWQRSLRFF